MCDPRKCRKRPRQMGCCRGQMLKLVKMDSNSFTPIIGWTGRKSQEMTYKIVKNLIIFPSSGEWHKELNRVSWNGRVPVLDLRGWNEDHTKMTKGTTLTDEEAGFLLDNIHILKEELQDADQRTV